MDTKQLKQKILDLAIRGKLVPQDPNDEPASVLLERIRKEKEQLIASGKLKRSKSKTTDTPHYENMPFEIPDSWEWVRLGELCTFDNGYAFSSKDYKKSGIPLVRISNIQRNTIDLKDVVFIQGDYPEQFIISKGDLLIAMSGATTGKMGIYFNDDKAYLNQRVGNIRIIDTQVLYPLYRNYFLVYKSSHILQLAYGGAQPNISANMVLGLSIPLPPIEEQRRIVAEIARLFLLIDNIENSSNNLQNYLKQAKSKVLNLAIHGKLVPQDPNDEPASVLLERINPSFKPCDTSHYENLPEGWTVLTVGEVADYINGRAFKPSEWEQTGLPIIRIQNLNDEEAAYNYSTAKFEDKYLVHNGDLLFAWAASLGTYIWQKEDAWLNQHIFKVIPKPFIVRDFLYYSFINMIDDFYAESHGSGMVHITKGKFETRPILIPPLTEQKRIVERIETIFAQLDTITAEL